MTKHQVRSVAFKRQVVEEFNAGATLHALSRRHDVSRQLIPIWARKVSEGKLDEDVAAEPMAGEPTRED